MQNFVFISDTNSRWNGLLPIPKTPNLIKINFRDDFQYRQKKEIIEELNKLKPYIIFSRPSVLLSLMKYLKDKKLSIKLPQFMMVSGEKLDDDIRKVLQSFFDVRIYNQYTQTETGYISCECPLQNGLHFESNRILIEIVNYFKMSGVGKIGEIVTTDLINHAMPMIRYKTNDLGTIIQTDCDCGDPYRKNSKFFYEN